MGGEPDGQVARAQVAADRPVEVLVCDDHEVLRQGVRTVLAPVPDLTVVGEAADPDEALALAARLRPRVALLGEGLRGGRAPAAGDLVAALAALGVRVVLLGESSTDLVLALQAGATGYVHTTVTPQRLVEGLRAAARGETVLDPAAAGELLQHLDGTPHGGGAGPAPRKDPLTARQTAVSRLVAEGLSNAEIAERLDVSPATVKGHITVALRRLGLRDRTQLAIHVHRTSVTGGEGGRAGGPAPGTPGAAVDGLL
ncbi:response regulator transcription factor [Modestobacter sp. NPDC049651]|uniref:response regulator transcription factor n=1 Tax=unclassified Modestobacter TaxID=2643866 RepID=UPI0033CBB6DB